MKSSRTEKRYSGLQKLDVFGKQASLTIDGKDYFSTNFGGVLSIISFMVILLLFG